MDCKLFRRRDGVMGVGFRIDHCGRQVESIAWEQGQGTRHTDQDLVNEGIELIGPALVACEPSDKAPTDRPWLVGLGHIEWKTTENTLKIGETIQIEDGEPVAHIPGPSNVVAPSEAAIVESPSAPPADESEKLETLQLSEPEPMHSATVQVEAEAPKASEADAIRAELALTPNASNKQIIEALAAKGVAVNSSQVSKARKG